MTKGSRVSRGFSGLLLALLIAFVTSPGLARAQQPTAATPANPNWCSDVPASPPPPGYPGGWAGIRLHCTITTDVVRCTAECRVAENFWAESEGKSPLPPLNPNWCPGVPASPAPPHYENHPGDWAAESQLCMNTAGFDATCMYLCEGAQERWARARAGTLNQKSDFPESTTQPQGPFPVPGGGYGYILPVPSTPYAAPTPAAMRRWRHFAAMDPPYAAAILATTAARAVEQGLVLEGTGGLTGTDPSCTTNSSSCPGTFTATVSGRFGRVVSSATLQVNFQVQNPSYANTAQTGGPVLGCYVAGGTGTLVGSQYKDGVGFSGQLCVPDDNTVELAGPIWIDAKAAKPGDITRGTGTLIATGTVHIAAPNSPIPASGLMVVSVVGAVGQIPMFAP